jgi:hypothetical protein
MRLAIVPRLLLLTTPPHTQPFNLCQLLSFRIVIAPIGTEIAIPPIVIHQPHLHQLIIHQNFLLRLTRFVPVGNLRRINPTKANPLFLSRLQMTRRDRVPIRHTHHPISLRRPRPQPQHRLHLRLTNRHTKQNRGRRCRYRKGRQQRQPLQHNFENLHSQTPNSNPTQDYCSLGEQYSPLSIAFPTVPRLANSP